jgi:hypothetical protein
MKGKTHVDSEALKQQWAEEDAAEQREIDQTAANARIEQIINAKKFQLGSRAVERANLDDELYKDAIAQAAREGHNVEHLFEDNDNEAYHGKHRLDDKRPNYIPEEAWTKLTDEERHEYAAADALEQAANELKRPDAISQEQWDGLSDEEKRNLLAYEATLRDGAQSGEPEVATGVAIDAEGSDPEKPSWKNPKERVLYLMRKAQANLWTLSKNPEKDHQRRKIAGWVAGGIAVAAAAGLAYLEIKGHSVSHPHNPNNTGSGPTGGGAGAGAGGNHIHTVTLKRGSNPWEISRHQLELHGNSHPTDAQILAYDKKLGRANGYKNWNDWAKAARHLMPRMKLKLPK